MSAPNRLLAMMDPSVDVQYETYADIGRFIADFSTVEYVITQILADLVQARDLERFDIVTRGMDAKVKCDRLRAAIKLEGSIGPNLCKRLSAFERKIVKLRNQIAHAWHVFDESNKSIVHLSSVSASPHRQAVKKPHKISQQDLRNLTMWMGLFRTDLIDGHNSLKSTGIFETDHPLSYLPPAERPQDLQLILDAMNDRRTRNKDGTLKSDPSSQA